VAGGRGLAESCSATGNGSGSEAQDSAAVRSVLVTLVYRIVCLCYPPGACQLRLGPEPEGPVTVPPPLSGSARLSGSA
jgi:hypothetical protein